MPNTTHTRVAVSGSFHRHMDQIQQAVDMLRERGVQVLSPSDPRVVDEEGAFVFVASDRHRSVRLVQDRHLAAIKASDFLWLVCPDGYVGQSASMELGFAAANQIPVYSLRSPDDLTLRRYVEVVSSLDDVLRKREPSGGSARKECPLLLDPVMAVAAAHDELEALRESLTGRRRSRSGLASRTAASSDRIRMLTSLPTRIN